MHFTKVLKSILRYYINNVFFFCDKEISYINFGMPIQRLFSSEMLVILSLTRLCRKSNYEGRIKSLCYKSECFYGDFPIN